MRRRKLNKYSCCLSYARTLLTLCKDDDNIGDEESSSCSLVGVQDIIFPHSFIQKVQKGHHLFRYKLLGISWYAEPSELQRLPLGRDLDLKHIVRNESVALFALFFENHQNYRYPKPDLYEMWVTDDDSNGAWTKQLTIDERTECPPEMFPQTYHIFSSRPVALWSDEFLMVHSDERSVCFNLCTTKLTYIPIETLGEFVGYVNSRVSVMGRNHKPESMENNCSDKDEDAMVVVDGKRESCRRRYTYSVSAIQPADVSHRIKKVMEGLRAEFGACPCKQFYDIFKPPLLEVDGCRFYAICQKQVFLANQPDHVYT
nr:uncharacterized protein LOC108169736 isoform X1 [Malus domestica]